MSSSILSTITLVRFCSTLALSSCYPTSLQVPPGHPADAAVTTPLADLSAARLARRDFETELAVTRNRDHHAHDAHEAVASADGASEAEAAPRWTCPMHPEVLRDGPGSCPICGMHLIEKKDAPPGGQP